MKKRVVAVMLIAVMTTLLAVGCGEKNSNQKEENSTKTEDTQKELEKDNGYRTGKRYFVGTSICGQRIRIF